MNKERCWKQLLNGSFMTSNFVPFLEACNSVTSPQEFRQYLYPHLIVMLPHTMFCCVVFDKVEPFNVRQSLNVNFPEPYLDKMVAPNSNLWNLLANRWKQARRPLFCDFTTVDALFADPRWQAINRRFGINNIAGHGVFDINGGGASYFGFAGLRSWGLTETLTLELLVPHLHKALESTGVAKPEFRADAALTLSQRESEVMRWVAKGKTDVEIAQILSISHWTVKMHVRNSMAKLYACTRGQAVAKAIEIGALI